MQDIQDCWAPPHQLSGKTPADHLGQLKERLSWARRMSTAHLVTLQAKQIQQYDQQKAPRSFQEGEWLRMHSLLFLRQGTHEREGPFTIMRVLGPVNYEVRCGPRHFRLKTLHVNYLKKWHVPDKAVSIVALLEVQPPWLSSGELPWEPTDAS